jgi:hypothetical protein
MVLTMFRYRNESAIPKKSKKLGNFGYKKQQYWGAIYYETLLKTAVAEKMS